MQWLFKVGNKKPSLDLAVRLSYWADCQLVDIRPTGTYRLKDTKSFCIIEDGQDFWKVRGSTDWKSTHPKTLELKKFLYVADGKGLYPWEVGYDEKTKPQRVRDWFLDYKYLLDQKVFDKSIFDKIYNKSEEQLIYTDRDLTTYLFHEDVKTRLPSDYTNISGTIAQDGAGAGTGGGFTIGAAGDYATVTAFEADIAAQLTGDLHGLHLDEETAITGAVTFDTDTNTHTLYLTAESGAEHDGSAYGNGARINYGTSDYILIDNTVATDMALYEISKLAIDASGTGNIGIYLSDAGEAGDSGLVNRMLIKGDVDSFKGIYVVDVFNVKVRNNIIYGFTQTGNAAYGIGIDVNTYDTETLLIANNTVIGCNEGIVQNRAGEDYTTLTLKNNLVQACVANDYRDDDTGVGWDVTGHNVSEDATSPDAAYDNTDVHTNSVFKNYAADDYRLDSAGDATNLAILDDGEDLSGTFTDDIEGQTRDTWYIGASEIVAGADYNRTTEGILPAMTGSIVRTFRPKRAVGGVL